MSSSRRRTSAAHRARWTNSSSTSCPPCSTGSRPWRRPRPPRRSRYDASARRQRPSPPAAPPWQGPRSLRGGSRDAAARGERPGECVRRGAARAGSPQGCGADPAERVLVRARRDGDLEPLSLRRRGRNRGTDSGARGVPRRAGGPLHARAPYHSRALLVRGARVHHRLRVGRVQAVRHARRRAAGAGTGGERPDRPADLLARDQSRCRARRERHVYACGEGARPPARRAAQARESGPVRGGSRPRGATGHHHRRYEVRVRQHARRSPARDRRDSHARLLPVLARRSLRTGPEPAELRQAAVAGLSRGPEARGSVGRQRTAAAAATGGRAGDERAVFGGVQADYGSHSGAGMRLAPEGWPFILPGWVLVVLGAWVARGSPWVWVPEVVLFLLAVWLLVFFRDPSRSGPRGEQYVIAPADGKIVDVQVVDEPMYLKTRATRLSIFMSVFDVHVNRYPATGTVELVRYNPGRFLHAASDKASLENEQASVGLRGARGPLLVRQIAGLIARRIVTDGAAGARAMQGARMGMIRFGSRVDVFVPAAARSTVRVAVGDRVQAGATVLAEYAQ